MNPTRKRIHLSLLLPACTVHGYKFGGERNRHRQVECVRLLLETGADKTIPNNEKTLSIGFLDEEDSELMHLLR